MDTYDIELIDSSTGNTIVYLNDQTSMPYFKGLQVTLNLIDETKDGDGFDVAGKTEYTVESVRLNQRVIGSRYLSKQKKHYTVTLKN